MRRWHISASLVGVACLALISVAEAEKPAAISPMVPTNPLAATGLEEIIFATRHRSRSYHWYDDIGWFSVDTKAKLYCEPGSQLRKLNLRTGAVAVLLDDPKGAFRDPQVHYDGKKIIFSWRRDGAEYYRLYEISVDGTGLKQVTDGPFDDIEPAYLPDGGIVFASTRCNSWVCCGSFKVTTIHRCDPDPSPEDLEVGGKNIRKLSANALNENTPWVLPDGRVLYMRWEYVDRNQMRYQHLWTMNPDGTGVMVYYGNQFPGNVFIDGKPIPGTQKVIYTELPGHGTLDHVGTLMVVDPRNGPDDRNASTPLNLGNRNNLRGQCMDPYPIAKDCFLFSSGRTIFETTGEGETRALYSLPGTDPDNWLIQEPRPIMARQRERIIPSRVNLSESTGTLLLGNIYHGRNMQGIKPGEIKKLLVLEQLSKPVSFQISWNQPISMGGTFTFKRILGTVPVDPDGSAYFKLPAMRNLFFVALDEDDMSVKRMQSFLTVQPGEIASCIGCHENRTEVMSPLVMSGSTAVRRPASDITPIRDVPDVIDFPRDIQPILDKHCVSCHGYDRAANAEHGPRAGKVILTGDHGPWFSHSYVTLTLCKQFSDARNDQGNRPPRSIGSSASPLMKKLDGQHHDVKLSPLEKKKVRLWIETGAAYPGTYAAGGSGMIDLPGHSWGTQSNPHPIDGSICVCIPPPKAPLDQRCVSCHRAPPTDPHLLYNLSRPEKSLMLLAPLAISEGGLGLCKPAVFTNRA
ncbi:MAG: hypothetical protein WCN95_13675, partial [bacterium]